MEAGVQRVSSLVLMTMAFDNSNPFLVERSDPLLAVLDYAKLLSENAYYRKARMDDQEGISIQSAREKVRSFIQAAFFIIEGVVQVVPELKKNSFIGSYPQVKKQFQMAMEALNDPCAILEAGQKDIAKAIMVMQLFAVSLTYPEG